MIDRQYASGIRLLLGVLKLVNVLFGQDEVSVSETRSYCCCILSRKIEHVLNWMFLNEKVEQNLSGMLIKSRF